MGKSKTSIKPGEIKNPNGRPKGTPNRTTAEMKEFIAAVLSENLDRMREDFEKMTPATRWTLLEKYGKYVIPTLAQTQVSGEINGDFQIKVVFEEPKNNSDE